MPKIDIKDIETQQTGSAEWMKFEQGSNPVRIASDIYRSMKHRIKVGGKLKNIVCRRTIGPAEDCPVCMLAESQTTKESRKSLEAKQQFAVKVIDRRDGKVKILESGSMIFGQLKDIAEKYGSLTEYDVDIKRRGSDLDTEYTLLPERENKPMTDEETTLVASDDLDLDLFTTPRPVEDIKKILRGEQPEQAQHGGSTPVQAQDLPIKDKRERALGAIFALSKKLFSATDKEEVKDRIKKYTGTDIDSFSEAPGETLVQVVMQLRTLEVQFDSGEKIVPLDEIPF